MTSYQGPKIPSATDLTYDSYLRVPELIGLQTQVSDPIHHDELLFIIIHQAYELWFKLMIHELEYAIQFMRENRILRAHHFVKRVVEIQKLLVRQIHILETMVPAEFMEFRDKLNPASGFQSTQFREIEFLSGLKEPRYLRFFENDKAAQARLNVRLQGPDLWNAYLDLLSKNGYKIPVEEARKTEEGKTQILEELAKIYQSHEANLPLYLLSETLVDFDEYLIHWRQHHVRVVERVIGFKRGLAARVAFEYLESAASKKAFPLLWEVRTVLK